MLIPCALNQAEGGFGLTVSNFLHRLNLESLKDTIQEKYERILMYFGRDIETIQKIYQRHRNDPPVAWDLPPIAGKIAWARQMYRRIQEPMEMFQKYPTILQTPEAKKIIKNYNKLAKVLLEFEVLYHQAWMQQVGHTRTKQMFIDNKRRGTKFLHILAYIIFKFVIIRPRTIKGTFVWPWRQSSHCRH